MIVIKNWKTGETIFKSETAKTMKECVLQAIKEKKNLRYADLRSADLSFADLGSADLGYADLGYADLGSADLGYADLGSADLSFADLSFANLSSANLVYCKMTKAVKKEIVEGWFEWDVIDEA